MDVYIATYATMQAPMIYRIYRKYTLRKETHKTETHGINSQMCSSHERVTNPTHGTMDGWTTRPTYAADDMLPSNTDTGSCSMFPLIVYSVCAERVVYFGALIISA